MSNIEKQYEIIPIELIDENPDNEGIFGVKEISELAEAIRNYGFQGAIDVYRKEDGRYEIISGHRRYRAVRENGDDAIPCIVQSAPSEKRKAELLLGGNINVRDKTPLMMGKMIDYYKVNVMKSADKWEIEAEKFFHMTTQTIKRLHRLIFLVPELQELADDRSFPYGGLDRAFELPTDLQEQVAESIHLYINQDPYHKITGQAVEKIIKNWHNKMILDKKTAELRRKREEERIAAQNKEEEEKLLMIQKDKDERALISKSDDDIDVMPLDQLDMFDLDEKESKNYIDNELAIYSMELNRIASTKIDIKNADHCKEILRVIKNAIKAIEKELA